LKLNALWDTIKNYKNYGEQMRFEWDQEKAKRNLKRHEVS